MSCKDQENHSNHICQLKAKQEFDKVKELAKNATHFCKNCEAASNKPENLCDPKHYKGTVGILKWK